MKFGVDRSAPEAGVSGILRHVTGILRHVTRILRHVTGVGRHVAGVLNFAPDGSIKLIKRSGEGIGDTKRGSGISSPCGEGERRVPFRRSPNGGREGRGEAWRLGLLLRGPAGLGGRREGGRRSLRVGLTEGRRGRGGEGRGGRGPRVEGGLRGSLRFCREEGGGFSLSSLMGGKEGRGLRVILGRGRASRTSAGNGRAE